MSIALQLYIQLTEAKDDDTRARIIADAFAAMEARLAQVTARITQAESPEHELGMHSADSKPEHDTAFNSTQRGEPSEAPHLGSTPADPKAWLREHPAPKD